MKKLIILLAFLVMPQVAFAVTNQSTEGGYVLRTNNEALYDANTFAQATTKTDTVTQTPTPPKEVTTTVKGGSLIADVLDWVKLVFGTLFATAMTALAFKAFQYFGIKTDSGQMDQLNKLLVDGINDAEAKATATLRGTKALDVTVKGQIMADAVKYAEDHGRAAIKALGLNKDGEATLKLEAMAATVLNNPRMPTPASITPPSGLPTVNGVVIEGTRV